MLSDGDERLDNLMVILLGFTMWRWSILSYDRALCYHSISSAYGQQSLQDPGCFSKLGLLWSAGYIIITLALGMRSRTACGKQISLNYSVEDASQSCRFIN